MSSSPRGLASLALPIPRPGRFTAEKANTVHGGFAFADVESLRLKLAAREAKEAPADFTPIPPAYSPPKAHLLAEAAYSSRGDVPLAATISAALSTLKEDPKAGGFSLFGCFWRRNRSRSRNKSKKSGSASSPRSSPSPRSPPQQPFYKDDNSVKGGSLVPYIVEGDAPLSRNELYRRGLIRFTAAPPRSNATGKGWTVHGASHFSQRIAQCSVPARADFSAAKHTDVPTNR
jgi:hypothetical protein